MGRINALAPLLGADGKPAGGTISGPTPVAATATRSRLWWAVVGAAFWFLVTTAAQALAGGQPVDGSILLAAATITCLAGALFGRSWGDDVALAVGSVAGLLLSSVLVASGPSSPAIGDVAQVAFYLGAAILVLTPLFRRLVGWMRTS